MSLILKIHANKIISKFYQKMTLHPHKLSTYNSFNQNNFEELTNKKSNKFQNILAFSLIELSIILIIIGLLIAGIIDRTSLIESTKIVKFTREINNWKQAVNTFYALKGQLPGNVNNDGIFGYGIEDRNMDNYFPSIPFYMNTFVTLFIDLYLSKIITFKPEFANGTVNIYNLKSEGAFPESKIIKDDTFYYYAYIPGILNTTVSHNPINFQDISTHALILNATGTGVAVRKIEYSLIQNIETKMDDKKIDSGSIRAECDDIIDYAKSNKTRKCQNVIFKLDI